MFCLGIDGNDDHSTKFFGGHKPCYDGQWTLTSLHVNKRWKIDSKKKWKRVVNHKSLIGSLIHITDTADASNQTECAVIS